MKPWQFSIAELLGLQLIVATTVGAWLVNPLIVGFSLWFSGVVCLVIGMAMKFAQSKTR
jgi:hypothetical protein